MSNSALVLSGLYKAIMVYLAKNAQPNVSVT